MVPTKEGPRVADREFKSNLLATLWDCNPLAAGSLDMTPDQIISRIEFALHTTKRRAWL